MRIRILSDLHQEFGEADVPEVACDCVVLAGDVSTKLDGVRWIRQRFPEVPVVYLCGNHEYYGDKYPSLLDKIREETQGSNIHFLEDSFVTIGGLHFYGCTLWTDFALHPLGSDFGVMAANSRMNDYKRIRNSAQGFRKLLGRDTRAAHARSLRLMGEFFATHRASDTVVVTHHAPCPQSLPEKFSGDEMACAYASNLEPFLRQHQPALWVHGHIHTSSDYHLGNTRVLANPRGYPDEINPNFIPDLVVEVGQGDRATDSALADLYAAGILVPPQGPPLDPSFFQNCTQTCAPLPYDKSLARAVIAEREESDR